MSLLMHRLVTRMCPQFVRICLDSVENVANISQTRTSSQLSATEYDEEADDRDRFKHDKFYNTVVAFGTPVMLSILFYMGYLGHTLEKEFDQDKYVEYPYLCVRKTPLPWGDGNHSLFHNPEVNFVPGVGFEKKQVKHH